MSQTLNALIVEDSAADAKLLIRELQTAGYSVRHVRVETAPGLEAALATGGWDVVFCDYTLPLFSGQKALALTRQLDQDLPFVYVSGTMGEEVAIEALKAGANDYVMKDNLKRLIPATERGLREAKLRREHRQLEADRLKLIEDLQAALAEVKRLSGLLPICATCKRIRNERGEWQSVESYIQQHSAAEFTHGVCPKCLERMTQEMNAKRAQYEQAAARING